MGRRHRPIGMRTYYIDLLQRLRECMFSLLRLSRLQPFQLGRLSRFCDISPPATQQQIRKMSAQTIAVLNESELKDGEL